MLTLSVTVHVVRAGVFTQLSLQPVKVEPTAGVAVSMRLVPVGYLTTHGKVLAGVGQFPVPPPEIETLPDPVPDLAMVRVLV